MRYTPVRPRFEPFLLAVERPGRYLGLERNVTRKDLGAMSVTVCLAFPDAYEIGMSHTGTKILYEIVNRRPDWACEMLSPSNARRDLVDKFQVLHRNGVPHYCIVDPLERTLIVHRWEPRGYLVALTAAAGDVVRAEPFDPVELKVSVLFGLEDDEE